VFIITQARIKEIALEPKSMPPSQQPLEIPNNPCQSPRR